MCSNGHGNSLETAEVARLQRRGLQRQAPIMTTVENSGNSSPLGATVVDGGVNFSLFSRSATGVTLLFFDHDNDAAPARVVKLDPIANRTYHYWHVFVPGVQSGQLYGYRVEGPTAPELGLRIDSTNVLLDPYGRGVVVPNGYSRDTGRLEGGDSATAMKSVVVDPDAYDWEGGSVGSTRPSILPTTLFRGIRHLISQGPATEFRTIRSSCSTQNSRSLAACCGLRSKSELMPIRPALIVARPIQERAL